MKNSITKLALIATILFTLINCSKDSKTTESDSSTSEKVKTKSIKDPVEFNNTIMLAINDLQKDQMSMNDAMTAGDYTKAEEVRGTWSKNLNNTIDKITSIETSGNEAEFQKTVLTNLETYKNIVNNKYVELIDIRKNKGDENKDRVLLTEINDGLTNTQNAINDASSKYQEKITAGN
ncbi:hypothetical protein CHRYSEOSP005_28560 [Chryseobacterium sp. Alg-005]|uniref:LIC11966 family surface protein n=1 Tax=Chryseobacterium sp. Alg-005 TaxID=3159516 RepID=UPI003555782C